MSSDVSETVEGACAKARVGRPPVLAEQERRQLILEAAETVFFRAGYGEATMEEIARVACMSKKSIYALYPDKRTLFACLVNDIGCFSERAARSLPPAPSAIEELRTRLLTLAEFSLSPRLIKMKRLVISEAPKSPELADEFHNRVIRRGSAYIAESVVRLADERGQPIAHDEMKVARFLIGAALSDLHISLLFGEPCDVSYEAVVHKIDMTLDIAVRGLFA
ncbi:transcriptional regulator, TetR family [Pseudoxanthobacter soli DSM 19599]|uniref:Transcriptional regulator, TetR family n=1 Tax=Pseudoxanthobacter soli DSM 19599 TaxID=1123029 RepID=A0A1M7Z7Y0_9HYPH|nr:TetR/AcrR family transcriptional regulator [Pseudoxanthobacter soli]SHO60902.1 transcriptional regulator, TetR family [Pseudoxanthobacter soli DSM 19599]